MPGLKDIQLAGFNIAILISFILFFSFICGDGPNNSKTELQSRINPNNAPPAALALLPGFGIAKANAIVEYRQQFQRSNRCDLAFKDCNDLKNIKGIGPKTVENVCKWLRFE